MSGVCSIASATLVGVEAVPIEVEVAVCNGLPGMHIVGMPDAAVQEARERVRSAMLACGFAMPSSKIVVNLAPGSIRKSGSGFDLPIALGILGASGQIDKRLLRDRLFVGELSLEGVVRPVTGVLAFAACARRMGIEVVCSADEQAPLDDGRHLGLAALSRLHAAEPFAALASAGAGGASRESEDFRDICGHEAAKRALQVAVSGRHGVLMIGPPGSGKTMLAARVPSIMPTLSQDEMMESAVIHSVAGEDVASILSGMRPFRSPHHSATTAGLIGGGSPIRPGEATLAHHGVLFLDELAEFRASTLQALRQPMEAKEVVLTRAEQSVRMPADFMLLAASNPCPCGYFGDDEHDCSCSLARMEAYRARIGGPLMDRIDIQLHVERIDPKRVLGTGGGLDSATLRQGVERALAFASWRKAHEPDPPSANAVVVDGAGRSATERIVSACRLDDETKRFVCDLADLNHLSGRGIMSLLRVSRTIADLAESPGVEADHVAEAACFRVPEGMGERR